MTASAVSVVTAIFVPFHEEPVVLGGTVPRLWPLVGFFLLVTVGRL
jgi:hypothetical protein